MCQLKEGIIFPTNFYTADIFNEYQNQKYKNFLTELSNRTEGERRSNRNGWQSDTFCGNKIFLNHFWMKHLVPHK